MGTRAQIRPQILRIGAGVLALAVAIALATASSAPGAPGAPGSEGPRWSRRTAPTTRAAFATCLPPGRAGTDNVAQLAQFETTGAYPAHWTDQQPLYDNLI